MLRERSEFVNVNVNAVKEKPKPRVTVISYTSSSCYTHVPVGKTLFMKSEFSGSQQT